MGKCGKDHDKMHMCAVKDKLSKEKLQKLTGDPKFVCDNCGAKVNKAANVCAPVAL